MGDKIAEHQPQLICQLMGHYIPLSTDVLRMTGMLLDEVVYSPLPWRERNRVRGRRTYWHERIFI
jgi:hypothetical protein